MRYAMMVAVLALGLGGCGITAVQRAELIDTTVRAAGERAEAEARKLLDARISKELEALKGKGATAEELEALKRKLTEEGNEAIARLRAEVEDRVKKESDARLPQADPDGGGWLGKLFGILAPFLLVGLKSLVRETA